jgi:hypothetical protein
MRPSIVTMSPLRRRMIEEVAALTRAASGEKNSERLVQRNGYRDRTKRGRQRPSRGSHPARAERRMGGPLHVPLSEMLSLGQSRSKLRNRDYLAEEAIS